MTTSRRSFLQKTAIVLASAGCMAQVIASASPAHARGLRRNRRRSFTGYGELVSDPNGVVDLPQGFRYRVFSQEGDPMRRSLVVPSSHDGMAAFSGGLLGTILVRNHELNVDDIVEDGLLAVPHVPGSTYDPEGVGGTTTLFVGRDRRLLRHYPSLSGTLDNCAGGPTPWGTWLSCEETTDTLTKPHGYVFEVDPFRGGNPEPIVGMGRYDHEAVAFDRLGAAYLTEDAGGPHGLLYRYRPHRRHGCRGSLHAGGALTALRVDGVERDLSEVQAPGTVRTVSWVEIPNPNPADDDTPTREQGLASGATPIQKCEGIWTGRDGSLWFVSSRGDGPRAEDPEDVSAAEHAGQIWRLDPERGKVELVVIFPKGTPYDEPDNITVGPHGFALACTDGNADQWLVTINDEGEVAPFAFNALNDEEFAGATFSPDGQTLFVNIQGPPGMTLAIWGPWSGGQRPC